MYLYLTRQLLQIPSLIVYSNHNLISIFKFQLKNEIEYIKNRTFFLIFFTYKIFKTQSNNH